MLCIVDEYMYEKVELDSGYACFVGGAVKDYQCIGCVCMRLWISIVWRAKRNPFRALLSYLPFSFITFATLETMIASRVT